MSLQINATNFKTAHGGFLTPTQQPKAPKAPTTVIEGREQQRVEVERLHQEPKKIGHDTVVTEDDSSFAGKLDRGDRQEEQEGQRVNQPEVLVLGKRHSAQV